MALYSYSPLMLPGTFTGTALVAEQMGSSQHHVIIPGSKIFPHARRGVGDAGLLFRYRVKRLGLGRMQWACAMPLGLTRESDARLESKAAIRLHPDVESRCAVPAALLSPSDDPRQDVPQRGLCVCVGIAESSTDNELGILLHNQALAL
eukprot:CAMPEP_0183376490 /NCGR_PEP_ID=MMETSP0164_2-20130417/120437_1 /TAXON_ID=221442 /ORGANISM="Coccolithus pelagicus ssp braarudi, Strain PLY182g" /LENGTH=148 /DNA_ID=CAMNT_0025553795 /DNA_START=248 /DNA_END=694 /DNA_ORIENTATION=+